MTKILLFKHSSNFVFIFVQNFKQFILWELYLNIFMLNILQWDELIDIKKTYIIAIQKIMQFAICNYIFCLINAFFYTNWFILLICA